MALLYFDNAKDSIPVEYNVFIYITKQTPNKHSKPKLMQSNFVGTVPEMLVNIHTKFA